MWDSPIVKRWLDSGEQTCGQHGITSSCKKRKILSWHFYSGIRKLRLHQWSLVENHCKHWTIINCVYNTVPCSTKISYPCSRKNTIEMIRQTIEMAHPMYDIICKALCSTSDMSCKNISSKNDGITTNTCILLWWHPLHTDRPAVLLLHPLALQSWWDGCSDTVLTWHYPLSWCHRLLSHLSPSSHIQHCTRKITSNIEFLHIYYNLRVREVPVSTRQIVYATHLQNAVNIQLAEQIKSLLS